MQPRWDRSQRARFAAPQVHAARRRDCRACQRGRPMTTTSHPGGFPDGFLWGASTAAFQIEGAAHLEGRRDSIWDAFCRIPGAVLDDHDGEVACDHYFRYPQDARLMRELNLGAYRFSTSWARVRPDGGTVNRTGLDFYSRLVDELLSNGVQPWLTLYHWDLPQALEERGGWTDRETAYRFVDYALSVHDVLGDRVDCWTTLNEPWCSAFLGYGNGQHAPGRTDRSASVAAAHHLLLAHGMAAAELRSRAPGATIGISLNLNVTDPADPQDPDDVDAARRVDGQWNRMFLDPLFRGEYPQDVLADTAHLGLTVVVVHAEQVQRGPDHIEIAVPAVVGQAEVGGVRQDVLRVLAAEQRIEEHPVPLAVHPAGGVDVVRVLRIGGVGDVEVEADPDRCAGRPGPQLRRSHAVREEQVMGRSDGRAAVAAARRMLAVAVPEERRAPGLVERRPAVHAVAEDVVHAQCVVDEPVGGLPVGPAAALLECLGEIPVVEGRPRLHAVVQQLVDQPGVEVQPGPVDATAVRPDPGPGGGEPVGAEFELPHQPDVLRVAEVVVAGDLAVVVVQHGAGDAAEGIPDGVPTTLEVRGALDLEGRGRGTPQEAVREAVRMGGRRHRPSSLAGTAIVPPCRMNLGCGEPQMLRAIPPWLNPAAPLGWVSTAERRVPPADRTGRWGTGAARPFVNRQARLPQPAPPPPPRPGLRWRSPARRSTRTTAPMPAAHRRRGPSSAARRRRRPAAASR